MSDIVYCKDCAYAEPNNLDAYHATKIGVFCKRYRQNTAGIHGCDNGKPKQKTNADRIRGKDDEGLAEFIYSGMFLIPWCDMDCGNVEEPPCKECILRWLKQEEET